jgi:hypothetical protein
MVNLSKALQYFKKLTEQESKRMFPKHVSVELGFDRDIKAESDGYMRPVYYPDGKIKFKVVYNTDLIEANLKNLSSNGIKGLIVHELSHVYDFINNRDGFMKAPHKNSTFTTQLAKGMNAKRGSMVYRAAMQPDVSTACAIKRCKNNIAPAWLSNYWLYFCNNCGYYDAYVTDLRAKRPVCESCGSHNLITKKLPISLAAKMDQAVTRNPKSFDTDGEIKRYILRELMGVAGPKHRKMIEMRIHHKKLIKKPNNKRK